MLTIVSASNRNQNKTSLFAKHCESLLKEKGIAVRYFSLDEIPSETSLTDAYDYKNSSFSKIAKEFIEPSNQFLFLIPEYNGSYPGILKLFIDGVEPKFFHGKKACLIGLSSGFAGNLRGMDHFCDVLNYLDVHVMPKKLSIARIDTILEHDNLIDEEVKEQLDKHITKFLTF